MNTPRLRITLGLTLSLLALAGTLLLLGLRYELPAAHANPDTLYVAPDGDDGKDCASPGNRCRTVQRAVDAAANGDEILVATGVYTGVSARSGITQAVYISKTVAVRGGYTTTNWTTPYPITQPTTLDAQGQGRVIYIIGDTSPTIEGLRITGGNAAGLGGGAWGDSGGGVYMDNSAATLNANTVSSNTANVGGGLYLQSRPVTLTANAIFANTGINGGGGLFVNFSAAVISGNTILSNTTPNGSGGGLYLNYSPATLNGNTIGRNTGGYGGGVNMEHSAATLTSNTIKSNVASAMGGGLTLWKNSLATLDGNTVISNTAADAGGGLTVYSSSDVRLNNNIVLSNTAGNTGGGLFVYDSNATLVNTVVADNHANNTGGGLYISACSPRLLHTTIARNTGGDGSGIYATNWGGIYSAVVLTNTILVSHTVGIIATAGNAATLDGVLWYSNTINYGAGAITVTNAITGNPAFAADGYHLTAGSKAIDAGVDAGVTTDIDGDPRPAGQGYDLGADEFPAALSVTKQADPDPVQAGAQLTYTIRVTNTGYLTLTATITDFLPSHVTPPSVRTWTATITQHNDVWTQPVLVTVDWGYSGTLTNVVRVTTLEGATGIYTATSQAQVTPALQVTKQGMPDPVQAGAQLTYTIRVTNTGNVTLNGTVTDTLPAHVTPTGIQTWPLTDLLPGGVWTQTIVVTVEMGYPGPLTNVVEVTTVEGATAICTATSQAQVTPALQATKQVMPNPVQAGAQLTYTIRVTNTGYLTLTATITDFLPSHVTPPSVRTWTATITQHNDVWTQFVLVTVDWGYSGTLTNVVRVTTLEGATGIYTATSQAQVTPALQVTKQVMPNPVQAGAQLTYTIRVTNTGNVTLNGTVTDTLPAHVTPTGIQTWPLTDLLPGGVWTQTVIVTVEIGYTGIVTNRVQVTSEENAAGEDQVAVSVTNYKVYLPVVVRY